MRKKNFKKSKETSHRMGEYLHILCMIKDLYLDLMNSYQSTLKRHIT